MQALPGFRDFYPTDCARREYLFAVWRDLASRYGFLEFDGPMVEPVDLYRKKSGGELVGQLFDFIDKGERHVALRPELTPTFARMLTARERDFKKPVKWFSVGSFNRYEKQQRGRLREFYQFNCDLAGDASAAADAEIVALAIDGMRLLGFGPEHFRVRLSDRRAWAAFAAGRGVPDAALPALLDAIDKMERVPADVTAAKLSEFGLSISDVEAFLALPGSAHDGLAAILPALDARGLGAFVEVDLRIVRGLAYYTGLVFEIFDKTGEERAIAGGGRYDHLLGLISDGKCELPAVGFAVGDVVLGNMIDAHPGADARRQAWIRQRTSVDAYVVVAKEELRAEALGLVQSLRDASVRVDFSIGAAKVGKQFQAAEASGATVAIVVGDEWPKLKIKWLADRTESLLDRGELPGIFGRAAAAEILLPNQPTTS
jgi:histidyl-tRNA synthetase